MSLWDTIRGELIDIVEWLDDTKDTLVYRFERHGNEIKNEAQLVVREGQAALFVNEGQLADVFATAGTFTLNTRNLPVLTTLKGWKYGFNSPFKAEVYFINTRRFTNLKWGLKNPLIMRDREFGMVRVRAFGTYGLRVADPGKLLTELVSTNPTFSTDDIKDQIRNIIVSRFADILGESKIPVLDLAANYNELGEFILKQIQPDMLDFGLEVTNMMVENISLPPKVEETLDKRTNMGIVGDLSAYTQYQAAESMEAAAKNSSGQASAGIGMGMGFAVANQMAGSMSQPSQHQTKPATAPPLPDQLAFHVAIDGQAAGPFDMAGLKKLVQSDKLTRETLVWKQGMENWTDAGQITELQSLFASVPPPLPPR
ncbi:MAG: SPFH domain-containing protein [Candidatus Electrothrix sp. EH2]|nr:SPFH domain-containing protein [Candidatus Electrothrix sp. EH2]